MRCRSYRLAFWRTAFESPRGSLEIKHLGVVQDPIDLAGASKAPLRCVGSVWLELKHIPDAASNMKWGAYLYARWRSNGRKRSKYIGKAT